MHYSNDKSEAIYWNVKVLQIDFEISSKEEKQWAYKTFKQIIMYLMSV